VPNEEKSLMTDSAFITMLVVLVIVWGGFAGLLAYALRQESRKRKVPDKKET
jgi:hypothetical protein